MKEEQIIINLVVKEEDHGKGEIRRIIENLMISFSDFCGDSDPRTEEEIREYLALYWNHVKEFEIWVEGYAATGEHGPAHKLGVAKGKYFDEAVREFMRLNPDSGIERNTIRRYVNEDAYYRRKSNWNIWACNLYDNEAEARKAFG